MQRLDQGHLHPKLGPKTDMSCRESNLGLRGGSGALNKVPFEQFFRNIYIWARDQWKLLATLLLYSKCHFTNFCLIEALMGFVSRLPGPKTGP